MMAHDKTIENKPGTRPDRSNDERQLAQLAAERAAVSVNAAEVRDVERRPAFDLAGQRTIADEPFADELYDVLGAIHRGLEAWVDRVGDVEAVVILAEHYAGRKYALRPGEFGTLPFGGSTDELIEYFEELATWAVSSHFVTLGEEVPPDVEEMVRGLCTTCSGLFELEEAFDVPLGQASPLVVSECTAPKSTPPPVTAPKAVAPASANASNSAAITHEARDFAAGFTGDLLIRPARTKENLDGPNARLAQWVDVASFFEGADGGDTTVDGVAPILEVAPTAALNPRGSALCAHPPRRMYLSSDVRCRHSVVVGRTGVGKTTKWMVPLLANDIQDQDRTVIVLDSKGGELLPFVYELTDLHRPGERVQVLDFLNPDRSCGWNPIDRLTTVSDMHDFAERLCNAVDTRPAAHDSEFWLRSSIGLLTGLLWAIKNDPAEQPHCTVHRAYQWTEADPKRLSDYVSKFDAIGGLHAFVSYLKSGSQNADTILADLRGRLNLWMDHRIATVTSNSELRLADAIRTPSVVVLRVDEEYVRKLRPLTNAFFSELVSELFKLASSRPGGQLEYPVSIVIEELASAVGRIPELPRFLNTVRSRRVMVTASIQSVSQVQAEYGSESLPLLAGFGTKVFFPNVEVQDAEYASSMFGRISVNYHEHEKTSVSDEAGDWKATRVTESTLARRVVQRPLLSAHEIRFPIRHTVLGGALTFDLPETQPFQAFVSPAYKLAQYRDVFDGVAGRDKRGLERQMPMPVQVLAVEPKRRDESQTIATTTDWSAMAASDTRGWTDEQIRSKLEDVKKALDWPNTTGSANKWWGALEIENKHRLALVLRLAEELAKRKATITEFFLAYVSSNTDNIQANLYYLDYTRLKKEEEKKKRDAAAKAREAANAAPQASPIPPVTDTLPSARSAAARTPSDGSMVGEEGDGASADTNDARPTSPHLASPEPNATGAPSSPQSAPHKKTKPKKRERRSAGSA